jgi:phage antirepressor YoqD-like protein
VLNHFSGDSFAAPSLVVRIEGVELTPIEIDGKRYLTFTQIDQVHQRPAGTAKRNFYENREEFIDEEDFRSTNFVQLQKAGIPRPNSNGAILITETGYSMLVKSFTDKLSWKVQRQLVSGYFRAQVAVAVAVAVDFDDTRSLRNMLLAHMNKVVALEERAGVAETKNVALTATVEVLEPKAAYADKLATSIGLWGIRQVTGSVGAAIGMKVTEVEKRLVAVGFFHRLGEGQPLMPTAKYRRPNKDCCRVIDKIGTDGKSRPKTFITPIGRQEIFRIMGIPPQAEMMLPGIGQ